MFIDWLTINVKNYLIIPNEYYVRTVFAWIKY